MNNQGTTTGEETGRAEGLKEKIGDAAEQVKETASHVASDAREKGGHLMDEGKEKAQELTDKAESAARSRAETEKHRVATGIRTFADALRSGSRDLSGEREQFKSLLHGTADRAERLSNILESRDVDAFTSDVRRFAREHTSLFVGGAFALGFVGARFLKSSEPERPQFEESDRFTGYDREDRFGRTLPERGARDIPPSTSFGTGTRTYEADADWRGGGI